MIMICSLCEETSYITMPRGVSAWTPSMCELAYKAGWLVDPLMEFVVCPCHSDFHMLFAPESNPNEQSLSD